jgi:hypothetical protein
MVAEWLSPKLYTLDNLRNYMSSKDFNLFSPANMLKEIRDTYKMAKSDADKARLKYGYHNFDPSIDLKRG